MEALRKRCSVRSFAEKPVEPEKIRKVLEAGLMAPSARNMQDWRFIVVTDRQMRARLAVAAKDKQFVGEAPVVIVACGTSDYIMTCGEKTYPIDVAIAVDHMTLAATDEGLGTCWIGAFHQDKVKELLDIPGNVHVVALLPMGYPLAPHDAGSPRKPFGESVSFERWK